MAAVTDQSYTEVKDELARTIRKLRSDCVPGETARQLLTYETPNHTHLVGIDHKGRKAVYYSCLRNEVIFVRFDNEGLADGGPMMGSFEKGPGFAAWIDKMGSYWGWVHPRYR